MSIFKGVHTIQLLKTSLLAKHSRIMLLPFLGIILFGLFYTLAAINYPGGSWAKPETIHFSIRHNYLCDLLDEYAVNGELNTGRNFAKISLGMLCGSLMLLWSMLPGILKGNKLNHKVMVISGISALGVTLFLTSGTHDLILRIAGLLGTVALVSSYIALWRSGYSVLCILGIAGLVIFGLNYYIYETGYWRSQLPVIQKITFVFILGWMMLLNRELYRKVRASHREENKEQHQV
ncbi:hypothetical protein [Zeaxanthinibacter enoshimensis]|nr:hypothetical protein [Zeaxanthinibacter enoshimensis]